MPLAQYDSTFFSPLLHFISEEEKHNRAALALSILFLLLSLCRLIAVYSLQPLRVLSFFPNLLLFMVHSHTLKLARARTFTLPHIDHVLRKGTLHSSLNRSSLLLCLSVGWLYCSRHSKSVLYLFPNHLTRCSSLFSSASLPLPLPPSIHH